MKTITLSPEVKDVLTRSTFTDTTLTLPDEQLPRPLYDAVAKVIDAAGGKWNRKQKCHVFARNPKETLLPGLESDKVVHIKQSTGAFYTPANIAEDLVASAAIKPGMTVLEPSAGEGALADAVFNDSGIKADCYEIDSASANVLQTKGYGVANVDFLTVKPEAKYDRIVMNPPFARAMDIEHVLHARKFLKPGGQLISIMSPGFTFKRDKKSVAFRKLVEEEGVWINLWPGSFKESGTNVNTVRVKLVDPRK